MFNYLTGDAQVYIAWSTQLKEAGGIKGLSKVTTEYPEGYMLFLALLPYLPINPLYGIKIFSIVFDFLSALLVAKFVYEFGKYENKKMWTVIFYSLFLFLFLPTVLANAVYWGQTDSIYTFWILLDIYFYNKSRWKSMFFALGCGVAFKTLTILVLPVFIILYCKKKEFSIFNFLIILGTYLLWSIPAIFSGKSIILILKTIFSFGSRNHGLAPGFRNFYTLILTSDPEIISYIKNMGTAITFVLVACTMLIFIIKKYIMSFEKDNKSNIIFYYVNYLLYARYA